MSKTCSIEGCDKPHKARGYCRRHYLRFWRHQDPNADHRLKHGQSDTNSKAYNAWTSMRQRCTRSTHHAYKDYGGRGISIDPTWDDFNRFYTDMGEPPSPAHSLDRIDNNAPYGPTNCRWATTAEQMQNRRTTKLSVTETATIRDLYSHHNYSQHDLATIYSVSQSLISRIISGRIWKC